MPAPRLFHRRLQTLVALAIILFLLYTATGVFKLSTHDGELMSWSHDRRPHEYASGDTRFRDGGRNGEEEAGTVKIPNTNEKVPNEIPYEKPAVNEQEDAKDEDIKAGHAKAKEDVNPTGETKGVQDILDKDVKIPNDATIPNDIPDSNSKAEDTAKEDTKKNNQDKAKVVPDPKRELVVASLRGDNTSWLTTFFPDWKKNIYVVNDPRAELTVSKNKGREAMPFLTYIIDRYDSLPPVSIFIHSQRYQWHNEDPLYDGVPVLTNLRLPRVEERGYVALRCSWTMGCPAELWPTKPSKGTDDRSQNEAHYASVFREFFPDKPVPDIVGAHCSSQFAVSKAAILSRPKSFYLKVRDWLLETKLDDQISGRIIEYMWHIIFGREAIDCEDAGECFCKSFGLCDLKCKRGECEKRYILPKYATIPKGWPAVGPGTDGWPERDWAD